MVVGQHCLGVFHGGAQALIVFGNYQQPFMPFDRLNPKDGAWVSVTWVDPQVKWDSRSFKPRDLCHFRLFLVYSKSLPAFPRQAGSCRT
jgi:hypothetical protein